MSFSPLFNLAASDLRTEAEVETRLLAALFRDLGYPDVNVVPKARVPTLNVQEGVRVVPLQVDFLLTDTSDVARVVVEAKDPTKPVEDAWGQAASYALSHNRDKPRADRVEWLLISNGHITSVYRPDSDTPSVTLQLHDFASGTPPYVTLRTLMKFERSPPTPAGDVLPFRSITPEGLNALFEQCHQLVWKKEKMAPADAFFEFCKFIFLKIREDRKRETSPDLLPYQLPLTQAWLEANRATSSHPVRDLLFQQLRDDLENAIHTQQKKRIYEPQEAFKLSADTTRELIKRFEGVNLSTIDEDLNGRMFEVFLNAAIRGKDLGQFFTPRPLVDFMTRIALHAQDVSAQPIRVIDACCGTGGFLIEVMAYMISAIRNDNRINDNERKRRTEQVKNEFLFGIEGNERVSRIARINMYLHGDGGSHVFLGDGLDSVPVPTQDMPEERRVEATQHCALITERSFDLVLTNPPFSMAYSRDNADEARILDQLTIATGADSVKSNVLFLQRYYNLLRPGGQLLIVLDDTVLNGSTLADVRQWILDSFVIIGVHSMPFNAFFKAKANIKTSVLHLRKKTDPSEAQGHVFMSISNNIGHDNSLKDTPERNNLNDILNHFVEWRRTGLITAVTKANQDADENLECPEQIWLVEPDKITTERIDAFAFSPELARHRQEIAAKKAGRQVEVKLGRDFVLVDKIPRRERRTMDEEGTTHRYIEIGDVTPYGLIVSSVSGTMGALPTRAEYRARTGDILLAINNSSRGTVVLVPPAFDGTLCTSGFFVIRPRNKEEGLLLWFALRSEHCRAQIYYLAQTASQPELKKDVWNDQFLIPIPDGQNRADAIAEARTFQNHIHALLGADAVRLQ